MKKSKIKIIATVLLMAVTMQTFNSINVEARNFRNSDNSIYYDAEDGRHIRNLEQYLFMLNTGKVDPFTHNIEEFSNSQSMTLAVSDPSKKCSNIFGHKWSSWGNWSVKNIVHNSTRICVVYLERERYCTRKLCGAWQTETEVAFIENCNH